MSSGPVKLWMVFAERGEPREQRVADERQQHRLAEREDEPCDRERDPDDGEEPVRVAVHRREPFDHALPWLARRTHRAAQEVEARQAEHRSREKDAAPEENGHAQRSPRLPLGLDQHIGFATPDRGDLRQPGADLAPDRLVVEGLGDLPLLLGFRVSRFGRVDCGRLCHCHRGDKTKHGGERARPANDGSAHYSPSLERHRIRLYSFWLWLRLASANSQSRLFPFHGAVS